MSAAAPLRVGLLHFTAPPIVGGVEAIVGRQAMGLAARGHRVTVLCGRGGQSQARVGLRRLPALDSKYPPLLTLNRMLAAGDVPPLFAELSAQIERFLLNSFSELDVCVVHNAHTLHFNLPLTDALHRLARRGAGCPIVAWCHDLSWTNPLYQPIMRDGFPWTLLKRTALRTSYVVVSADRQRDLARLTEQPANAFNVIPAGVELAGKWGLSAATRRLLRQFDLIRADPFILLPVRITRRKNIEFAIDVIAELKRLSQEPKLLVTGPRGPHDPASIRYVRELQQRIERLSVEREVILLQADPAGGGPRWRPSDAMMDQLYRTADLMLLPSAQEGFGIPVLEAGSVGLPVWCSEIPPFREIAAEDAHFFALDESPSRVAEDIRRFIESDQRYRLRKRVALNYDWDAILDQRLVPLLRRMAGSCYAGNEAEPSPVEHVRA